MTNREKILWLQEKMKEKGLSAYLVPTADYHQSEYLGDYFKTREFLSGFTGSAGTLVVLPEEAFLWTDGRYHIQAAAELEGSSIQLMKQGLAGVPSYQEFLQEKMGPEDAIGFDAKLLLTSDILLWEKAGLHCVNVGDLCEELWQDRPAFPLNPIYCYEKQYHGEDFSSKLQKVREDLEKNHLDYQIFSNLDDIAWLFNLRGSDVESTPVFMAFALVGLEDEVIFYTKAEKVTAEVAAYLKKEGVVLKDYFDIFEDVMGLDGRVALPFAKTSYAFYEALEIGEAVNHMPKTQALKAIKNEVEIANTRHIHMEDGLAVTKFMYWLKEVAKNVTEIEAEDYLTALRAEIPGYQENSFHTIAAFGPNAAMMHYQAKGEEPVSLGDGLFLVDSGGQYFQGTTDITRTFALGEVPEEQKRHFTLVLKGMIDLSKAKFMYGVTGSSLDVLARQHVWAAGIDYKCGTGHGVGHFLGVHEGPHGIRVTHGAPKLEAHMVVTNEPGVYIANSHGIRIENELLVQDFCETEHGRFLEFETLTLAPIDLDAIQVELLDEAEKAWLNAYHKSIYESFKGRLNDVERAWLAKYCRAI